MTGFHPVNTADPVPHPGRCRRDAGSPSKNFIPAGLGNPPPLFKLKYLSKFTKTKFLLGSPQNLI
jgi:hypothetical protein